MEMIKIKRKQKKKINKSASYFPGLIDYRNLSTKSYDGVFIGNERGFGFVTTNDFENDIFIAPTDINTAMDGDFVSIRIKEKNTGYHVENAENTEDFKENRIIESHRKRKEGVIVEIKKRNVNEVIGLFIKNKDFGFVVADNRKLGTDIYIPKKYRNKAKNNDKVLCKITQYPSKDKKAEGKITEILGKFEDPKVDFTSILKEYDYKNEFPKEVLKEAKEIPQIALYKDNRVDLREKEIFTIDGIDTKDIDDAISLEKSRNKYILGIHIADVSSYVEYNSKIDKEAQKRATSVYLINKVLPMLPKELSNGICSLNENEDRYAISLEIVLDKDANVLNSKIYKSIINSKKKMTYDDVFKTVANKEEIKEYKIKNIPEDYLKFQKTLCNMRELAEKLILKRHNKGAIDFDIPESKIVLDENDKVISIKPYEITIANKMIEQFMVLANEIVALKFSELELPFVYRIHEIPDKEKIEKLNNLLFSLGYPKILIEKLEPIMIQKIIEESKGKEEEKVIAQSILRTMQLAKYYEENEGHFGLALDNYCHFTSPIRRYPDLFIHRIISDYLENGLYKKKIKKYKEKSKNVATNSSLMEQKAEEAERELVSIKMCEYMQEHIGEEYDGVISNCTNFGFYVELENTIEGLVHVENLKDDYYVYDELNCILVGERTKKKFKIGQRIKVRVLSTNKLSRRIDFEPIK